VGAQESENGNLSALRSERCLKRALRFGTLERMLSDSVSSSNRALMAELVTGARLCLDSFKIYIYIYIYIYIFQTIFLKFLGVRKKTKNKII
jgi:hypothetical protein